MSLNKLMLIGYVGKDPDIRILKLVLKWPLSPLPPLKKVIPLLMEHRFLKELNGIMLLLFHGLADVVEKYVHREISCIWKER